MSDDLAWLKGIRALVFDMDGVLWRGKEALPGLNEIFDWMAGGADSLSARHEQLDEHRADVRRAAGRATA